MTTREIKIEQAYEPGPGRTIVVHDVPAREVTIDGIRQVKVSLAVARRLETIVDRALQQNIELPTIDVGYTDTDAATVPSIDAPIRIVRDNSDATDRLTIVGDLGNDSAVDAEIFAAALDRLAGAACLLGATLDPVELSDNPRRIFFSFKAEKKQLDIIALIIGSLESHKPQLPAYGQADEWDVWERSYCALRNMLKVRNEWAHGMSLSCRNIDMHITDPQGDRRALFDEWVRVRRSGTNERKWTTLVGILVAASARRFKVKPRGTQTEHSFQYDIGIRSDIAKLLGQSVMVSYAIGAAVDDFDALDIEEAPL